MRTNNGKIRFHIDFSFLVFNALVFLIEEGKLIFNFYMVCVIHEIGHLDAIFLTDRQIKSVHFSGAGIRIVTSKNSTIPFKHELFVLLAGPSANLLVFMVMKYFNCEGTFMNLNLALALYNLLPYHQLDGGAVIDLLISGTAFEKKAEFFLLAIKLIFSAALLTLYMTISKGVISVLIVSVFLLVSDLYSCKN